MSGAAAPPASDTEAAFEERMWEFIGSVRVVALVDLGHRLGLFEAAASGAGTPAELAHRTGLAERPVREWLSTMAAAGILRYDPAEETFSVPPAHTGCLTGASHLNLAWMAGRAWMTVRLLPELERAFRDGQGIAASAYEPDLPLVQDALTRRRDEYLLTSLLPAVEGLQARLEQGASVVEIGCGTGHTLRTLARAFPDSSFVGCDVQPGVISTAQDEARRAALPNASFVVGDAALLSCPGSVDVVLALDVLHDVADPVGVLRAVRRVLAPDGALLVLELALSSKLEENLTDPWAWSSYASSTVICLQLSLAAGGPGLGSAWGRQRATAMLAEAGFDWHVVTDAVDGHDLYVCRPVR